MKSSIENSPFVPALIKTTSFLYFFNSLATAIAFIIAPISISSAFKLKFMYLYYKAYKMRKFFSRHTNNHLFYG